MVDYREEDFIGVVKGETDGRGADVIFDPVGGDVFDGSRRCVAFEGRIVVIGFAGGRIAEAPTNHLLVKNYSVLGLHWGLYNKVIPELAHEVHKKLVELYEKGAIGPPDLPFPYRSKRSRKPSPSSAAGAATARSSPAQPDISYRGLTVRVRRFPRRWMKATRMATRRSTGIREMAYALTEAAVRARARSRPFGMPERSSPVLRRRTSRRRSRARTNSLPLMLVGAFLRRSSAVWRVTGSTRSSRSRRLFCSTPGNCESLVKRAGIRPLTNPAYQPFQRGGTG